MGNGHAIFSRVLYMGVGQPPPDRFNVLHELYLFARRLLPYRHLQLRKIPELHSEP